VTAVELSRPIRLDAIGSAGLTVTITADATERAALAARFGLVALDRFEAAIRLERDGDKVRAEGSLIAEVVQSCIATAEPIATTIDEKFALRFVPETSMADGDEIELSETDCDTLAHDGKAIELGEAIAETLALAIDPFPRSPDADAALRGAGVLGEDEPRAASSPFAGLAKR
jgi:uncharacterized metal-binding protein YceD (DUF177 family)